MNNQEKDAVSKVWKTVQIIWVAMLLSVGIYLFVGIHLTKIVQVEVDEGVFRMLRNSLYTLSVIEIIAIKFIRKSAVRSGLTAKHGGQKAVSPALARYTTGMIITLAIAESVAVYGLVLVLLGKNTVDLFILTVVAALAMLYYRPRREELYSLHREFERTHG